MIFNGRFRRGEFTEGVVQLEDKIIKGDFTYSSKIKIFNKNYELMYEGNLKNLEIFGEGKLYMQANSLNELNIPNEILEAFRSNIPDFESLNLVLHATFINEKEIDLDKEVKITQKENGLKIVAGHLKEGKSLFVYTNGNQIECNPFNSRERQTMVTISSDFRVRD